MDERPREVPVSPFRNGAVSGPAGWACGSFGRVTVHQEFTQEPRQTAIELAKNEELAQSK